MILNLVTPDELEEHCYWGNEVKLYEHHVDALFVMFWRKKPNIKYYVCTIIQDICQASIFRSTTPKRIRWTTLTWMMIHRRSGLLTAMCMMIVASCCELTRGPPSPPTCQSSATVHTSAKETSAPSTSRSPKMPPCSHRASPLDALSTMTEVAYEYDPSMYGAYDVLNLASSFGCCNMVPLNR
ncbi:unnamed protein product [Triticum turgidum subsp. durum]|uniref:Uncharacterized protein n=1 Tax=Triticum turgidum subsp. durum TaxID=4567 RepID=A0A9R0XM79_TRITD|nr:unnamed protein product [Triticum turgidum subsp. durum]